MRKLIPFSVLMISMIASIGGQTSNNTEALCQDLKDNRIDYAFSSPRVDQFANYLFIGNKTWNFVFNQISDPLLFRPVKYLNLTSAQESFHKQTYRTGFGVSVKSLPQEVVIGGLTLDYQTIMYYTVDYNPTDSTKTGGKAGAFASGFGKSDFRPQVAFTTFSRLNESTVVFIESKTAVNGKYPKRVQVYRMTEPKSTGWINETSNNAQSPFRRRRQTTSLKVPLSVWFTADEYLIKSVVPLRMESNGIQQNFVLILVELCTNDDIPCSGTVTYKYCVVPEEDKTPTSDGKPCHKSNLKPIAECISDQTDSTDQTSTDEEFSSTHMSSSTKPTEEEKSLVWIWIVIIFIVISILIVVLIVFLMRFNSTKAVVEKESKSDNQVNTSAADQPIQTTKSDISSSTKSGAPLSKTVGTDEPVKTSESAMSSTSGAAERSKHI